VSEAIETLRSKERAGRQAGSSEAETLGLAVSLHLAGKREEALELLQKAVTNNQASAEIWRALGHIEFELDRFEAAAKSYRALTRLKPRYAQGWFDLAVCLERAEIWDQASEAFEKARDLDATNLDAQLGLALCLMRREDPKKALICFERVLELSPDH